MGRIPAGCISLSELGKGIGIPRSTAAKYARKLGITGYIPAERAEEVRASFVELRKKYAEKKSLLCRKGTHAMKVGILTMREIGEAAGCDKEFARYLLHKKGWPHEIPPERLDEAVAVIKGYLAEKEESHRNAVAKEREAQRKWHQEHRQKKAASRASPKPGVEKSCPPLEESKPCDWRVSMLGRKGWLVVRCGTQEEMVAWARMLRDNGFTAEAAQNSYTPGVQHERAG